MASTRIPTCPPVTEALNSAAYWDDLYDRSPDIGPESPVEVIVLPVAWQPSTIDLRPPAA